MYIINEDEKPFPIPLLLSKIKENKEGFYKHRKQYKKVN